MYSENEWVKKEKRVERKWENKRKVIVNMIRWYNIKTTNKIMIEYSKQSQFSYTNIIFIKYDWLEKIHSYI